MSATPDVRHAAQILGRIGAHEKWARCVDRPAATQAARTAFDAKFLAAADGDPVRAGHLRSAHFQRLSLKSAQARRRAHSDGAA